MTRNEFLSQLGKRLEILTQKERDDILGEYSQHIDFKMAQGLSEEAAIQDFGDIDELAASILEAYNIDPGYNQKRQAEQTVADMLHRAGAAINEISNQILKMDSNQLLRILCQFLVVCLCLFLARIPFELISSFVEDMFRFIPRFLFLGFASIWHALISLIYIIFVCYVLYLFIRKSFLADYQPEKKTVITGREIVKRPIRLEKDEAPAGERKKKSRNAPNVGGFMMGTIVFILKFTMFLIILPFLFMAFAVAVIFGLCAVLSISGLPLIGITVAIGGGLLCLIGFLGAAVSLIFQKAEVQK